MKKHLYYLSGFLLMIFSSCEKEVDINLPEIEPKLVVTSFISPQDTIIQVEISKSTPLFEKQPPAYDNINHVTDAIVVMSGENESVTLNFNEELKTYIVDADELPIIAGKTYHLKVTTPEGLTAEGSCTVPYSNNTLTFDYTKQYDHQFNSEIYLLTMIWSATPQDGYGFRLFAEHAVRKEDSPDYNGEGYVSPIYIEEGEYIYSTRSTYRKEAKLYFFDDGYYDNKKLIVYLLNLDEHYFRYHISRRNQGDNPFAEPSPLYTNIEGGLGVFCAYNFTLVQKEF